MHTNIITHRMLEQTEERVETILEAAVKDSRFATRGCVVVTGDLEASFGFHVSCLPIAGTTSSIQQAIADALDELKDRVLRVKR